MGKHATRRTGKTKKPKTKLGLPDLDHSKAAFVGRPPGKLLLAYAPADKIEAYFRNRRTGASYNEDAESYRAYGMELIGPPLDV